MGYIQDKLERIKEFKSDYPDIYKQFIDFFNGCDGISRTGKERVAHLECFLLGGKKKDCIERLQLEGISFSQSTLKWIVMHISRRINYWEFHNPKHKLVRVPKGTELRFYGEVDEYLKTRGLKRSSPDEPIYIKVERIDGKRFRTDKQEGE